MDFEVNGQNAPDFPSLSEAEGVGGFLEVDFFFGRFFFAGLGVAGDRGGENEAGEGATEVRRGSCFKF